MPPETPTPPAATQPATTPAQNTGTPTQGSAAAPQKKDDKKQAENTDTKVENQQGPGNVTKMKEMRAHILGLGYKYSTTPGTQENSRLSSSSNIEVVDIVHDYPWIAETVKESAPAKTVSFGSYMASNGSEPAKSESEDKSQGSSLKTTDYLKKTNIPVCYISERKSVVNAGVANFLGLLSSLNDVGQMAKDGASADVSSFGAAGQIGQWVASATAEGVSSFKQWVSNGIASALPGMQALLNANNLNDEILNPYRFLYITADTHKRYVFPLANNESSSFIQTKLTWGQPKGGVPGFMKALNKTVDNILNNVIAGGNLVRNITALASGEGDDTCNVNEKIKAFSYPETGDMINIKFTLYNTTKKNAWKNNFRFLYLWAVRNLPFRTETISFLPPLLYDIIIPGVKRMPVCAVTSFKVTPSGMTRLLECPNFIDSKDGNSTRTIPVNVPEAWVVEIGFQSLIAPSANLMLANTVGEMGIQAALDFTQAVKLNESEQAAVSEQLDAQRGDMDTICKNIQKSEAFDKAREQMEKAASEGYGTQLTNHLWDSFKFSRQDELFDEQGNPKPGTLSELAKNSPMITNYMKEMEQPITDENIKKYIGTVSIEPREDVKGAYRKYVEPVGVNKEGKAAIDRAAKTVYGDKAEEQLGRFEDAVKYEISNYEGYELLEGSSEYAFNPDYIWSNNGPEWYLSNKGETGSKSEREEKQAKLDEYNAALSNYNASQEKEEGKRTPVCEKVAPAATDATKETQEQPQQSGQ